MFFLYSVVLTLGFVVLLPRFIFDAILKGKYAAGFGQRLGSLPKFDPGGKHVIWLHCVSVGEVNAARGLAKALKTDFPDTKLVVSTTTRTGREVAEGVFATTADLIIYFPFDWRWTVRRALKRIRPSVVLLMETEIWFRFIREANRSGARIAIVNGRLSERSVGRYSYIRGFLKRILSYVDLALMQERADANRLITLGIRASKVRVTGNLKFDHDLTLEENSLTEYFRERFGISPDAPLVLAASTHAPEENILLDVFKHLWKEGTGKLPRLMIAPRHPERFEQVTQAVAASGFTWVRRSEIESSRDKTAEIILLNSIGELRSVYPLAEIVFVGGSIIPHGGQSVFEPAAAGKAIVTGPHTANFAAAVDELLRKDAIRQLSVTKETESVTALTATLRDLLADEHLRERLGSRALNVMESNRGAVAKTVEHVRHLLEKVPVR
jgi:3-deoxy-D-manno-octulosonic-acid transferase